MSKKEPLKEEMPADMKTKKKTMKQHANSRGNNLSSRTTALQRKIKDLGFKYYIVADEMSVRYFTGIEVPQNPFFLVGSEDDAAELFVPSDGLRTSKLRSEGRFDVHSADVGQPSLELLSEELGKLGKCSIGFDSLSAKDYLAMTKDNSQIEFVPDPSVVWSLRMIKSEKEIESAKKAARIADSGQRVASEIVRAGIREYEIAAEVEHIMRTLGSEDEGHRTVVTSGPRSALGVFSGFSSDRVINDGELVIVDTGATVDGYRSDLGRAYVAGKPSDKQRRLHRLLNGAWDSAFAAIRPGIEGRRIDEVARAALGQYEKFFDHEAGHGIGLSFEPPFLTKGSKDVIEKNMIVTVEPGIYIDGIGGMIIEDTNIVHEDRAERLTQSLHEWE